MFATKVVPRLNFELFIAKKIIKGKGNTFSRPIIRISIIAVALGIAMMTLSLSIVEGFQNEISNKVIGFGSHIQINKNDNLNRNSELPINIKKPFYPDITKQEGISHIQVFALKGAILKANQDNLGVVIKGVGEDFNWNFFQQYLIEGRHPNLNDSIKSNEILISKFMADKLQLNVGDHLIAYFIQQPPRLRKFSVVGLYSTGLGEMDEQIAIADIRHIQKINGWDEDQVGGFEILIDDIDRLDELSEFVYQEIGFDLNAISIKEARMDIFNWLELQDMNVIVIISLLVLVCGIDIISALLIIILERTSMIGILKALGSPNVSIRKIFLYNAVYIILQGLLWGNLVGLGFAYLQLKYGFVSLPKEAYFIDRVPINLNVGSLLLLNFGTLVTCILMLIIPSNLVAKIQPTKAIRFD